MPAKTTAVRALVVDYTPQIVSLIRAVLHTMNGIDHIDSTGRGDTAANLLEANDYDVVVLEAVVPYHDERLLSYLSRSRPSVCKRTIVITAAPVAAAVRSEIAEADPHAVLDKPFDVAALASTVWSCLSTPLRQQVHLATRT
jgi:DNA-binding response OmpR family regulator